MEQVNKVSFEAFFITLGLLMGFLTLILLNAKFLAEQEEICVKERPIGTHNSYFSKVSINCGKG